MEEQMHKQFYCPIDKYKTMFVEHATKKGTWICCQCRYTTSNPRQDTKIPQQKTNTMNDFLKLMKAKSCENKL